MPNSNDEGLISFRTAQSVSAATARLVQELKAAGMTLFTEIDHQENARAAGITMPPTVLLIFGNPQVGTQLMLERPSLAIDLPLKALVWEDADGQVWLSANSPEYLQRRHGLQETPFQALPGLLRRAAGDEG